MLKKAVFLVLIFLALTLFSERTKAQFVPVDMDALVPEPTCIAYHASSDLVVGGLECNTTCERRCIANGKGCNFGDPSACVDLDPDTMFPKVTQVVQPAFNVFSIELCPDAQQRPPDDPYCALNLVRLGFYGVISILFFVLIVMACWVGWVRSTAGDSAEKVEKAVAIARNAIFGAIIVFLFLAIVQTAALLVGLTGSLFDISIVPQADILGHGDVCKGHVVCPTPLSCKSDPADPAVLKCLH